MFAGSATKGWPFSPSLLRILRRLRRNRRSDGCGVGCDRDRTDDSRLPWTSGDAYGGWGGRGFHGVTARAGAAEAGARAGAGGAAGGGGEPTPIVFVHGVQRDACDWEAHAEFFLERGYGGDDLWAITFREGASSHPEMAEQLDSFVGRVREHTGAESVALVGHSLGVTGIRYWLAARGRFEWVETVVGLAGPNHGTVFNTWCAEAGIDGDDYRVSPFLRADYEKYDDHPLTWLNRNETPGEIDYYTVRGTDDALYWRCPESPELEGARNVVLQTGHDGVRTARETKEHLFEWLTGEHPYDMRHQVGLAR